MCGHVRCSAAAALSHALWLLPCYAPVPLEPAHKLIWHNRHTRTIGFLASWLPPWYARRPDQEAIMACKDTASSSSVCMCLLQGQQQQDACCTSYRASTPHCSWHAANQCAVKAAESRLLPHKLAKPHCTERSTSGISKGSVQPMLSSRACASLIWG